MQVWLPLLLIRQIFAPMKLEGPTKPATLGKVDDEEGGVRGSGGKVRPQLTDGKLHSLGSWTDFSGPALMLVVFSGGSKLDFVNSSCLFEDYFVIFCLLKVSWGWSSMLGVEAVQCAGEVSKLTQFRMLKWRWIQHGQEPSCIRMQSICVKRGNFSCCCHAFSHYSMEKPNQPSVPSNYIVHRNMYRCNPMYTRYCMFFSIDCIFLDMFIYLQYLWCFCAHLYPTTCVYIYIHVCLCVGDMCVHLCMCIFASFQYTECHC